MEKVMRARRGLTKEMRTMVSVRETAMSMAMRSEAKKNSWSRQTSVVEREINSPELVLSW